MRVARGAALLVIWGLITLVSYPTSAAAEPKVEILAEVVLASEVGNEIDPPSLEAMKKRFAEKTRYSSFKRLSEQTLTLSQAPTSLTLPNRKVASLTLESLKDGTARVRVALPPLSTVYVLGREGSLYQAAGAHAGGDLWLVLSAARGARAK